MTKQEIIDALRDERERLGVSKYTIWRKCKVFSGQTPLDKFERGESPRVSVDSVIAYAEALGMELKLVRREQE